MSADKSLTFQSRMVDPRQIALLSRQVTYTKILEDGLLADGLVIFGDNAYLNTKYMATPYPNIAGHDKEKSKDNYNFYHSQVSFLLLSNAALYLYNHLWLTYF